MYILDISEMVLKSVNMRKRMMGTTHNILSSKYFPNNGKSLDYMPL